MLRTFTCQYTDELILQNLKHSLGLRNFLMLVLLFGVFATLGLSIGSLFGEDAGRIALIVVSIVALLLAALYWYSYLHMRRTSLAALVKLPHRTWTFTFTDDEMLAQGPLGESRVTWEMFEKLECFKNLWRLQFLSAIFLIPTTSVDEELARFIEAKARDRGVSIFRGGIKVRD
jgi:hypothetical protein